MDMFLQSKKSRPTILRRECSTPLLLPSGKEFSVTTSKSFNELSTDNQAACSDSTLKPVDGAQKDEDSETKVNKSLRTSPNVTLKAVLNLENC